MFGVAASSKRSDGPLTRLAKRLIYGDDIELIDGAVTIDWKTFNLVLFGHDVPHNAARCPETVRLLRAIPGFQSAFFSILAPGASIAPHSDPSKGVLRYHLALKVPRDRANCFISVEGERYHWTEGRGVLFDDSFVHYVRNDTPEERVILFVDILRPLKGVAAALQGLANFANRHQPSVRRVLRASAVPQAKNGEGGAL